MSRARARKRTKVSARDYREWVRYDSDHGGHAASAGSRRPSRDGVGPPPGSALMAMAAAAHRCRSGGTTGALPRLGPLGYKSYFHCKKCSHLDDGGAGGVWWEGRLGRRRPPMDSESRSSQTRPSGRRCGERGSAPLGRGAPPSCRLARPGYAQMPPPRQSPAPHTLCASCQCANISRVSSHNRTLPRT